jgi:16S rRNA (cytosine1402-N4)-methyltransferase
MDERDELHKTVLAEEAVSALNIQSAGFYIDATFGRGGHSRAILNGLGVEGHLLALDRDPEAIEAAQQLAAQDLRLAVGRTRFGQMEDVIAAQQLQGKVNGVLFDLGVSSPQLDDAERGFSFMRDGPLDMRMDSDNGQSAAEWVNTATQEEIAGCALPIR